MSKQIHYLIKNTYDKKQKEAFDSLMLRKSEIYEKIPRVDEIDRKIKSSGLNYNKKILLGTSPADEVITSLLSEISQLKNEKQQLLVQYNYPPNYLEIVYECKQCNDTGYIDGSNGTEKCACYKQQIINHLHRQSNLTLSETENFDSFNENYYPSEINEAKYGINISPRQNILAIKERVLRFTNNFTSQEERNLFFSGPTGVGKTFMTNCIALDILSKGRTVLYHTAPKLFDIINEHKIKSFKDNDYQNTSYKNIFDAELLIIDDLGTESISSARYAELLTILNTRQINNLTHPCKTIISTNIGGKELYEFYTERVASRIIGSFDMFRFVGEDIRRLKKAMGK